MMKLYNYNTYNESIRDKMTPISKEEVRNKFDKFHPIDAIIKGIQNNLPWLVDEIVQQMISKHGKETTADILQNLGRYQLEKTMEKNNLEILEILLNAGYKVSRDRMEWAVVNGSLEAIKILVKYSGVVDKQVIDHCIRYRPNISSDIDNRKPEVIEFLKKTYGLGNRIKDVFRMDESLRDKMTPKSDTDIEKALVGKNRYTIFEKACREGVVDYVKKNIKFFPNTYMGSCVWRASMGGHLDVVKILVENNADVNYLNDISLKYAVRYNHYDVVEYLLENGADVNKGEVWRAKDDKMLNILKKYKNMK